MKIFLAGYMGSGKSTIGPLLANKLSCTFLDFDSYIESNEGKTISQIFEEKGEIYFRKIESTHLEKLVNSTDSKIVVALGGGTPCYGNNLAHLKNAKSKMVYLNWNYKKLAKTLWEAREHRPLIKTIESYEVLEDYIRKHLFERSYYYNQADVVINVSDQTPEEVTAEIIAKLF